MSDVCVGKCMKLCAKHFGGGGGTGYIWPFLLSLSMPNNSLLTAHCKN